MTETEKLIRDIDTLRESLQNDWADLADKDLSPRDRQEIRDHIAIMQPELEALLRRLYELKGEDPA